VASEKQIVTNRRNALNSTGLQSTAGKRRSRRSAFTIPLCREYHRQLHHAGNEVAWWHSVNIKPLPIAKALWIQSHAVAAENVGAGSDYADGYEHIKMPQDNI
jgi:hypothetical protein